MQKKIVVLHLNGNHNTVSRGSRHFVACIIHAIYLPQIMQYHTKQAPSHDGRLIGQHLLLLFWLVSLFVDSHVWPLALKCEFRTVLSQKNMHTHTYLHTYSYYICVYASVCECRANATNIGAPAVTHICYDMHKFNCLTTQQRLAVYELFCCCILFGA